MPGSDVTKGSHTPSPEEIREALGARYPLWERLTRFVETHYPVEAEWSTWGPAEVGWGLRVRSQGRALVALYPQPGKIVAQVVLGKAQAERALGLELGEKVSQMLRQAPQLRDGRWLMLPVLDAADAEAVEHLLRVKMPPTRRTD
jgi:hypothetical protein